MLRASSFGGTVTAPVSRQGGFFFSPLLPYFTCFLEKALEMGAASIQVRDPCSWWELPTLLWMEMCGAELYWCATLGQRLNLLELLLHSWE